MPAPAEIGRLLDARYLLEGSIRRAGDRLRVNVELTEAATGRHVWSETYDAEVKDIFAVQDDIARRVVGAAAVKLTRFEQERVLAKPTENLAAYEYVLRGREFLSHATREENDEARRHLPARDRSRPELRRSLCGARWLALSRRWRRDGQNLRRAELEQAETLAQKALALDPAIDQRLPPARPHQSVQETL